MKKLNKRILIITVLIFILILVLNQKVFALSKANLFQKVEYTDEFKNWLQLSEEEKQKVMQPRMYNVPVAEVVSKNPLFKARMVGSTINSRYSLKDIIPTNLVIRNQQDTQSCWAIASLSSLETNLALANKGNGKVYDFSERHMVYATSKTFANNIINEKGYNKEAGDGGNYCLAQSYLTNGTGAIAESQMPFENNENTINISQIQNKTVTSQVYDTVEFPDYTYLSDDKKMEVMDQVKQHIKNYGSVYASIHGNSSSISAFNCYNNDTGAKYCSNSILHRYDHAVSIIGWDDNYSVDNFAESARPTSNGAWIIRNSWGERLEYNLSELKEEIFTTYKQQCIAEGWNSANAIPNDFIEQAGYTIEGNVAYMKIGDNGLMYVSYEDKNIAQTLWGIVKASDMINYDNIYQYDELYPASQISYSNSNIILCNNFTKKTSGTEYLTQVSIYAPETYTCKVYVNPNGTSKAKSDMQLVQLKAGESETFGAGYHTLEFANPIEIKANTFAVAIEIQGTKSYSIKFSLESNVAESEMWNSVRTESGKCFFASGNDFDNCEWIDLSNLSSQAESLPNGDSSIKAFTTSTLIDESLKNIEIVTPPTKTHYFEGENFDKTGMVVKANYNSKINPSVTLKNSDYSIKNGSNLAIGQTSVTITYEGKSVNQAISVEKNTVTQLRIKTAPNKVEYKEGQNFDKTGMVIEATYKDGTVKEITDYTIKNGNNLDVSQDKVTISYGEKSIDQSITVTPNPLIEINITKAPDKTNYVVGQNFDKTGMIVTGTYQDESTQEIANYTIENGTNLQKEQTSITVKFNGKTATQEITVEEKAIVTISVQTRPSKTTYIQNKESLDLDGGTLKITYNDGTSENIDLNSEEIEIGNFDNTKLGKQNVTVKYNSKSTSFEVEIVEEAKAINTNLDAAKCDVKKVQAYYYTDTSKKEYTLINVEINGITRNLENDNVEYYYYLSTDANEENINDWIKVTEKQIYSDKLKFNIDTRKIDNYNEISKEQVVHLYIKEVAIKGGNQSVKVSNSMKLETNDLIETYIDNVRKDPINQKGNGKSVDETTAPGAIPQTGVNIIIIAISIIAIVVITVILRKRYEEYKDI